MITMKHYLHVYFTPSTEMQEIICYFVHSRAGVSSPPPLNVVTEGRSQELKQTFEFEFEFEHR